MCNTISLNDHNLQTFLKRRGAKWRTQQSAGAKGVHTEEEEGGRREQTFGVVKNNFLCKGDRIACRKLVNSGLGGRSTEAAAAATRGAPSASSSGHRGPEDARTEAEEEEEVLLGAQEEEGEEQGVKVSEK